MEIRQLVGAMATFAILSMVQVSSASLLWTIEEVGNDVVISTDGGTLNVSGLAQSTLAISEGVYSSFYGAWARVNTLDPNGNDTVTLDYYAISEFTYSKDWDSDYQAVATSTTGENYLFQENILCIPLGYVSGSQLSAASMTFANTSLTDMSLNEGERASWTWADDSMTVVVGAIPEPATFGLIGLFGGGIFLVRRVFMI